MPCTNKRGNLNKRYNFLGKYELPKFTQENMNSTITIEKQKKLCFKIIF